MTEFVVDTFYENIRAPMWVNFSSPDEVEGDSWFDTLSDTDDADRVRLMPTEFEIAQLLPDQVFDASTPEKPRSPVQLRNPVSVAVPAPVFSDDEAEDDDNTVTEAEQSGEGNTSASSTPNDCDVEMSEAFEDTTNTSVENVNVEETCEPIEQVDHVDEVMGETAIDAPSETAETPSDTTSEVTQPSSLPASPQMPKESTLPTEEDAKANTAAEDEALGYASTEHSSEETPVLESTEDSCLAVQEEEATATAEVVESEAIEEPQMEIVEPEQPEEPKQPEEPECPEEPEEPEEPEVSEESAEPEEPAQPEEVVEESESPVAEEPVSVIGAEAPHEAPCSNAVQEQAHTPTRLSVCDLVKPADISTPTSEDAELAEASTSVDSGLDLSAIVEEGEEDFLVHDEDAVMAEIDNKEAAMMEEIAQKRRALEEKKAAAEMLEVKVMSSAVSHPGLRTPTLQEAFQKHRKQAKKSEKMTLTEPQEFSFRTDARAQVREPSRRRSYSSASDSEASRQRAWTGHITEPQEFHFRTEERIQLRRSMRQSDIAEALKEPVTPSRQWTGELTEPKEFNFTTDERMQLRSMNKAPLMSSDEKDLQQCRDFKAYPLNRKVLESAGDLGVPRLAKRKLTRPHSPALATRDRSMLRKRLRGEVDEEEEGAGSGFDSGTDCQIDFAARFGREGDQANKLRRLSLTAPKPFSFQTEQRAAMRQSIRPSRAGEPTTPRTCYSSDCESSMANSAQRRASAKRSKKRKRATVQAQPLKLTEPKPFSFATDERALLKTPTKRRKMVDAAADSFAETEAAKKAFSSFDRFAQEPHSREQSAAHKERRRSRSLEPRKLTEPQPFRFQTEQRAQQAVVSQPRDAGSENTGNLFAPLSSVNKAGNKRKRAEHEAAPVRKKALRKVSAAKLNAGPANGSRPAKAAKKERASSLLKPTAASTAASAASKAIQKKTRTHTMKTRSARRKLTAPKSPMLQTRLRAAAIHGMRDL